ncbi:MAG: hypothetical protein PHI03_11255 [Bacteroidales bacterium]|jgi:Na+/pantothenate symporter|nr:hypothetical protein [Bacteroidales bacterium]
MLLVGTLLVFVAVYSSLSGLMSVSTTDSIQFVIAMTGSIVLATVAVKQVGGMSGLKPQLFG